MTEHPINIIDANMVAPSCVMKGEVMHHYESLLSLAREACLRKEFELAVILASCACEMLMERTFKLLFSYNKINFLYDSVIKEQWEYNNITNKKNRKLYTILSKDDIPKTCKKWSDLVEHYKRRNEVAHRGATIKYDDANKSIASVADFIKHIETILNSLQPKENQNV